ncbi:methyltransferase [Hyalangium sp.]|uniref:methyltransferase n=1 Tax=Hyalangium sp. TaxID=2028555 RepID=UPI002D5462EA|nr:methyltransferase [Hyalangium sp.]HYH97128.1 methyltransferase [Hyalangium sp.]
MSDPTQPVVSAVPEAARAISELFNPELPPQALMMNLVGGAMLLARCIYVAAELRLADLLAPGPRHVEDLARATQTHADSLYRMLCALESMGIVEQVEERRFRNTPLAEGLRSDVPGSARGWALFTGSEFLWDHYGQILRSVKTGKSVHENLHQMRFFEWYAQHPEAARVFNNAMTSVSDMSNPAIVAAYDFSGLRSLVDVAGGHGSLLAGILQAYSGIQGVLFDQPAVIEGAQGGLLTEFEQAGRCQLVGGDFFQTLPPGLDAYLFKWILHDWSDEEAKRLLLVARKAAGAPGRKLLVVEMVIDPVPARGLTARLMDIAMLTTTGGRERTARQYGELFAATGFELKRVVPTMSPYSIMEAVSV